MKQNMLPFIWVFLLFCASCIAPKNATTATESTVRSMLEQKRYTFLAQSVMPTEDARYNVRGMFPNGSNLYQLSTGYDVRITPDSVVAYLPFFGRSFTAPTNPSEGGIKFTSTQFSYKQSMRKGNYEIDIKPFDTNEISNVFITISQNGYATLRVLSRNKTPIAYNGVVEALP